MDWRRLGWQARRLLHRAGLDVVPYRPTRHPIARRLQLFSRSGIDLVVDVGANAGQYGDFLRSLGYRGDILSFEPVASAYAALTDRCGSDPRWRARRAALGDREGRLVINVSSNSECSSALPMLERHTAAFPEAAYVAQEEVEVLTLKNVLADVPASAAVFVKVDTQGYERQVIEGAGEALARVRGLQLEMSLVALYDGEILMPEMVAYLRDRSFVLMGIEPGFSDPATGQLLQIDGLFFRSG
jgi:FkbM family methyltransferase